MTQPAPPHDVRHDPMLCTCGCCEAGLPEPRVHNRAGLPALHYRIGTHAEFLRRMLARLPVGAPGAPALPGLTTREPDDPAVALLDAWATAADVLTFYQERIANEGFLRTATERRSVLELARTIGYELRPGVAASTWLAFTLETAEGAPERVRLDAGLRVQSVPGQDERPQTFETTTALEARQAWNALRPRLTREQTIGSTTTSLRLAGVNTGLQAGDAILLLGAERRLDATSDRWDVRMLSEVTAYPADGVTTVAWRNTAGALRASTSRGVTVHAFRQRASLFGHNAPDWRAMPLEVKRAYDTGGVLERSGAWGTEWPDFMLEVERDAPAIDLDAYYPKILSGSWLVLTTGLEGTPWLYGVRRAEPGANVAFTLSAKTTRVALDNSAGLVPMAFPGPGLVPIFALGQFSNARRRLVVLAQSEELTLAREPDPDRVPDPSAAAADGIELDAPVSGLADGHVVIVTGRRANADGTPTVEPDGASGETSEAAVVRVTPAEAGAALRILRFEKPLRERYVRASVTILANVVPATHGETVHEILGSGDGTVPNQRFTLERPPLTHVSAPSGASATLAVRVEGVLWREVPSLYPLGPGDPAYALRRRHDGATEVVFGDGVRGGRLPTGIENVAATYRSGIGPEGEVGAGQLTLLQTRPLGVREVTNPVPATGAAAPEALADARRNAPVTVLTLGRVVSLRDYEDFAHAFAGIGKARVAELWDGERRLVHLTLATSAGEVPDRSLPPYTTLRQALADSGDPTHQVRLDGFRRRRFRLAAGVVVDPRYEADVVLEQARARLREAFSFARRDLGQSVTAVEVIAAIQGTPGVVAVDLDRLYRDDDPHGPAQSLPPALLPAELAHFAGHPRSLLAAELLLLDPARDAVRLTETRAAP